VILLRPSKTCAHVTVVRELTSGGRIRETCADCHEWVAAFPAVWISELARRLEVSERRVAALEAASHPEGA
jgi:hypothetical protein